MRFQVLGIHKLWACKGQVSAKYSDVVSVDRADRVPSVEWGHLIKVIGTSLPGRFYAGTFFIGKDSVFLDTARSDRSITVELARNRYRYVVVEVADPEQDIAKIRSIIDRRVG